MCTRFKDSVEIDDIGHGLAASTLSPRRNYLSNLHRQRCTDASIDKKKQVWKQLVNIATQVDGIAWSSSSSPLITAEKHRYLVGDIMTLSVP